MRWGRGWTVVAFIMVLGAAASAQTLPWPGEPAQPQSQAPTAPATPAPAPMLGMPTPPPPMMHPPQQAMPQQQTSPCLAEFTRLREDVEKRGAAAKAASDRKAPQEEMCKVITVFVAAETKWAKYSETNQSACGIPPNVVKQIKAGHEHMITVRKRICEARAAGAGPPAAPSLSEALGTTQLPAPQNTTTKRGGTLDTLTGNPIR